MSNDIVKLKEDLSNSKLYSPDLAPVPPEKRTWSMWHLAALWVGMAVCIPTYLLSSYMIGGGMTWVESLIIIGLANLIITIPMVLNGHAGVKYGIPFPVIGRTSFGTKGIQIPSIIRAIVACGWFGINAWIGGLAIYAIFNALSGGDAVVGLSIGKFICFGIFWLINMYFIWKGTESIKFLEQYSAPILILMGLFLIGWGASQAGGFSKVLNRSSQLEIPAAELIVNGNNYYLHLNPLKDADNKIKTDEIKIDIGNKIGDWQPYTTNDIPVTSSNVQEIKIQFRRKIDDLYHTSSIVSPSVAKSSSSFGTKLWSYFLWLNIMVGFWATMSLSIADITRYAATQKDQVLGQFIGLPATMMLYSFVGIFVTCAATINFGDILISNDAPWDPVSLLAKFNNPIVVVISQIFMIIATLSTNIAANVIAPSNAFSNLWPKSISFKMGGLLTGILGILICPWLLMNEISGILIFVSGLLGPVLGVMLCDYYFIRKKVINLPEVYRENGAYSYASGFNFAGMMALILGVLIALLGYFIPALSGLYKLSWFTGFIISFIIYYILMHKQRNINLNI